YPFGGGRLEEGNQLPPARGKGNIFKIFDFLNRLEPRGTTDFSGALEKFARRTKRRGIAVVLSDFYDPAGYEVGLNALRYHRFEPTAVQIVHPDEVKPQIKGDVEVVDVESGLSREVTVTGRLLERYMAAHQAYCRGLEEFCSARGIGYFRAVSSTAFDELVLR